MMHLIAQSFLQSFPGFAASELCASTPGNKWGQTTFNKHYENVVCPLFTSENVVCPLSPTKGDPAKWVSYEVRDGVRIRVVHQPAIGRVITGFPDDQLMPPYKPIK
jgi:hypothetical protein